MSALFSNRNPKIFLLIGIVLLWVMKSSAQQGTQSFLSSDKFSLFPNKLNDSVNQHVTFARLENKEFQGAVAFKNSGILSTCNTSTFYLHLSAASGQKINLKELQTLPDGNFILTGNTTSAASITEGLVIIMSNSGNLVSQRQIRINNNPVTLFATAVMPDGNVVISGMINSEANKTFVALLHEDLSTDWVKVFDMGLATIKTTISLTEDQHITFATQQTNSIIYSLLNADGSVVWTHKASPQGLDELVGFNEATYLGYTMLTNCGVDGKKQVNFLNVNPDGSLNSSQLMGNGSEEYQYGDVKSFNGRILATGVKKSGALLTLTRDILAPSGDVETEHNYNIPLTIDFNTSAAFDNAGDVMGFCFPQQGKLAFIRQFAYYQTAPEHTREYDVPVGSGIVAVARSFTDGGFLFGLNTINSDELILIKTDSIGTLESCGSKTLSNDFTETLQKPNSISNTTQGDYSIPFGTGTLTYNSVMLNTKFDCHKNYCPAPPLEDTCLSTYFKTYRTSNYVDGIDRYYLMRNNNIVVSFAKYDRILGNLNTVTYGIKLLDEKGHFIKGMNVFCDGVSSSFDLKKIDDHRLMAVFYSVKEGRRCYTFTLFNDALQILWSKSYETYENYNFNNDDLVADSDGNFYFVAESLGFLENGKVLAFKMDPNGNPLWFKIYELADGQFLTCSATTSNTSLFVVLEGGLKGSVSVKFNKETGMLLKAYKYNNNSAGLSYQRFLKFEQDRIFYAGNDGDSRLLVGLFDTTGKPLKLKYINKISSIPRAAVVKDGNLYSMFDISGGSQIKMGLMKMDASLSVQFLNAYSFLGYPEGMGVSDNGSIYAGGNYIYGGVNGSYEDVFIQKYNTNGVLGTCDYQTLNPELITVDATSTEPAFSSLSNSFTSIDIPINFTPLTDDQNIAELKCSSLPECTSIKVNGPQIVCSTHDDFTYKAIRNQKCRLEPHWIYDTSFVTLLSTTNSSADLKFKRPGSTWIKASIDAGCRMFMDSILVKIQNSPLSFSLGNDTVMCKGDSIQLHAGPGFNSYQWQDGIDDSIFMVKTPGIYYVQVENLCGNIYTDTIRISSAIVPKLYIGNDTTICAGDTLQIEAPDGFNSYTWKSQELITGQEKTIYFVASQNETLSVEATTIDGCSSYDTLNITSTHARPIFLGNDTSFCEQNFITLSADPGYSEYTWSDGAATPAIIVNKAGVYWIKAKDINGCTAKDTLIVEKVYPLPIVNLGNDFNLCSGEERKLDAGNFNQYLWNDGSSERFQTVNTPGLYWVSVKDSQNCSSADSIILKTIFSVPSDFLKPLDSICKNDKVDITPLTDYFNYLWSTGSSQKSIQVQQPGQYRLTVTDENNCTGKDTIIIMPKVDCIAGIYFPNAFTPNGDHKNDIFNAISSENFIYFQLKIYNQWGEMVFSTNSLQNGWDGKVKGNPSDAGVFVWICTYQFLGSKATFKKGIVTLLR